MVSIQLVKTNIKASDFVVCLCDRTIIQTTQHARYRVVYETYSLEN